MLDRALRRNGLERLIGVPVSRWKFEPDSVLPPSFYATDEQLIAIYLRLALEGDKGALFRLNMLIDRLASKIVETTAVEAAARSQQDQPSRV